MRKLSVRHTPRRAAAWSGGSNRSGGFTLLETLLTVAILVILLGLSMVGVARYRDHLKITELDNAARDIYMAAENRAVLLQNSGQLGVASATLLSGGSNPLESITVPESDGTSKAARMLSENDTDKLNTLLPVGVIDPTLRNGNFRVVYDEATGHVIETFYTDRESGIIDANLGDYRESRATRVSNKDIVGHYQSDAADAIGTKPLATPGVEVIIVNGDELTLTVRYTMPALPTGLDAGDVTRTPSVRLEYKYLDSDGDTKTAIVELPLSGSTGRLPEVSSLPIGGKTYETFVPGETVSYTWVLDSLDTSKQFKELTGSSVTLGDDFTVTAGFTLTAPGYIDSAYYATGTDNSLFAKGSTYGADGTAQIANLRHLQNLCLNGDGFTSNVGNGTVNARQLVDINCETYLGSNYEFVPIVNGNLTSYNGKNGDKNTHIFNLSTIETADAGLFGTVSSKLDIDSCRVCWNKPEKLVDTTPTNKKYIYAVSGTTNAGGLIGCVSGTGDFTVTIQNSFASTTVSGTGNAGGLVGSVTGGTLNINNSYADCYLTGGTKAGGLIGSGTVAELKNCYAAGFIVDPTTTNTAGLVNGSVTNASNTYSVVRTIGGDSLGYPVKPLYDDVSNSVSGNVRYLNDTSTAFNPAADVFTAAGTSETHVYNLRYKLSGNPDDELKTRYPFRGLKDTYGNAIPHYSDWCSELPAVIRGMVYYEEYRHQGTVTNAYGVPNDSKYVGAEGKFVVGGNNYSDFSSYPLWDDFSNDTAKNNPVVVRDGYALLFMGGSVALGKYEVEYGGTQKWTLQNTPEGLMWKCELTASGFGETPQDEKARSFTLPRNKDNEPDACKELPGENYVLVLLPDAVVTGNFAYGDSFYQKLKATKVGDAAEAPANFHFNPLFAKTVESEDKTAALTDAANPVKVSIRTARHLYDLSRLYDTRHLYNDSKIDETNRNFIIGTIGTGQNSYIRNNYYEKGYSFLQELDIDYATYTWYGAEPTLRGDGYREQHPIGVGIFGLTTEAQYTYLNPSFKSNYDGGCHIIRNVIFRGTGYYLGLFGMTDKWDSGTKTPILENIVYELDPAVTVGFYSSDTAGTSNQNAGYFRAVGALAGKNDGIIRNCAVFGVNMEVRSKYVGGLLGYNQNTVTNCAAELASLTATLYNDSDEISCAGGLVGKQNTDTCKIENSYAVGKLVCVGSQGKAGETIAGLVAHKGIVSNCYAAVDLVVNSGTSNVERFGLCRNVNNEMVDDITNSCWLKDVYVYRGTKYNITATTDYTDSACGVTFASLKTNLTNFSWKAADNTVLNIPAGASYTSAYKDKSFPYLTGVKTTLTRDRDGSIIGKPLDEDGKPKKTPIHYGLWPAPLPVGLAYYEDYGETKQVEKTDDKGNPVLGAGGNPVYTTINLARISGQYENLRLYNLKEDTENPVVKSDGYALVFEGTTDVPAGEYKTEYGGGTSKKPFTLIKDDTGKWYWRPEDNNPNKNKYEYSTYTTTVDGTTYTVVPLPTSLVAGDLNETNQFYQKLAYGTGLFSEREFYFNPHFAGILEKGEDGKDVLQSVVGGTVADNAEFTAPTRPVFTNYDTAGDNNPNNPTNKALSSPAVWCGMAWDVEDQWENVVAVRTARHFYNLSKFQEYYIAAKPSVNTDGVPKRYCFKQELDIDYIYDWYGGTSYSPTTQNGYYTQDPIGPAWGKDNWNQDDGFKGAYNGGGHKISNVFYNGVFPDSDSSQYMGLFRYIEYLWDVTYVVPNNATVTAANSDTYKDPNVELKNGVKVGTLMGGGYRAWNCHAEITNLTVNITGGNYAYVGGLLGYAGKTWDCGVTVTGTLTVNGSAKKVSVGGLQGLLYNEIINCTGKVNSIDVKGSSNSTYYAGGLIGSVNSDTAPASVACTVSGCGVEIKDLRITDTVAESYAGGLIGYNRNSTTSEGGAHHVGGKIYASYAVGSIGSGNTATNIHYAGFSGFNHTTAIVQDCYSAVAVPATGGYNFCSNSEGKFTNCRYLSGSWTYGGTPYTAQTGTAINGVDAADYTALQGFTSSNEWIYIYNFNPGWGNDRTVKYTIPAMKNVTGGYPFPVGTRNLARDENGNVIFNGADNNGSKKPTYSAYYYPGSGSDWPQPIASSASLLSDEPEAESAVASADLALPPEPQELLPEPEELLPEPEALPPEPEGLPEPEEQDDEPEPESGDESEPTD